jgi:hypothetical protein
VHYLERRAGSEAGDEGGVGAAAGEPVLLAEGLQIPPLHPREIHFAALFTHTPRRRSPSKRI